MHITIDEISGDQSVVRFTYETGHADGVWRGEGRPSVGPADVEWSVPGRFWWDDDVRIRPVDPRAQAIRDDTFCVAGVAVGLADDGILSVRVGDGVVEFQTGGNAPAELIGSLVEVDGPLIELFPLSR